MRALKLLIGCVLFGVIGCSSIDVVSPNMCKDMPTIYSVDSLQIRTYNGDGLDE